MSDGRDDPDQGTETDRPLPSYYRVTKNGGAATVLGAAMLAVGEILEPQRSVVEIVHPEGASHDHDQLKLQFGDLPGLD